MLRYVAQFPTGWGHTDLKVLCGLWKVEAESKETGSVSLPALGFLEKYQQCNT